MIDGWTEILSGGGGITDIATRLVVLTGFAAALLGLAALRLRHSLSA